MSFLDAFGSIMDATHPTQANPYYGAQQITPDVYAQHAPPGTKIPDSPIWLDAHGNDITDHMKGLSSDQINQMTSTPYQAPNFWARLGRNGKEIANLNAQAQGLLGQQMEQRSARRASTLADQMTLPNNLTDPFGNPQTMATLTGGDSTASGIQNAMTSLGNIKKNLPAIASTANVNNALASGTTALNTATTANELANRNQPVTLAQQQDQATKNALVSAQGEAGNIPLRTGLENTQLVGANAAAPLQNATLLNQANIGASTSGQGVTNLPFVNDASKAEALLQDWQAKHPNVAVNPLAGRVDTGNNTVQPGRSLINTMMGSAMNGLGGGAPQTFSSGNSWVKPQINNGAVNPLANPSSLAMPTTSNTANVPQPQLMSNGSTPLGSSLGGDGDTKTITDLPIGADEALRHLGLKLDKDGNLQKINDWMTIPPESIAQAQKIQALVKSGHMAPTGKSHVMRQLLTHYLGSHLPTGSLNQGY